MSAYGHIPAPSIPSDLNLPTMRYNLPQNQYLTCFPITKENLPKEAGEWLCRVFNEELVSGKTYPQEDPMPYEAFLTYFFGYTTIIGILSSEKSTDGSSENAVVEKEEMTGMEVTGQEADLEYLRGGRKWEDCLGGCYYIKPNYPGRASHNCNAGFIVAPQHRGLKIGRALAKSYLIYGKNLGYRGSVFNLVFANNIASLRLWDTLGFTRAGLIPKAGRLKTGKIGEDGKEVEEYVDAVVIWKDFTVDQ